MIYFLEAMNYSHRMFESTQYVQETCTKYDQTDSEEAGKDCAILNILTCQKLAIVARLMFAICQVCTELESMLEEEARGEYIKHMIGYKQAIHCKYCKVNPADEVGAVYLTNYVGRVV